jgi:adhesin/invasin
MRKCSWLSGLFLCILMFCVCGCGGSGSSADPMGTGTVQFIDEAGVAITSNTCSPSGSVTLTAKVTNQTSAGTTVPVIGERVSFSLLTANGGTLLAASDRTGSGGIATAIYTAGNNMASDTVRITTDVGATASITITKTGGIIGARISTLAASSTTVADGQTSAITATVTDGNSNPMQGETVTFTIPVNASGASFVNASGISVSSIPVTTDAAGLAVATYLAGGNSPSFNVYDTIRATLANGSANSVAITRSAGVAAVTGYVVTVTANPSTIKTSAVSVVTANVKDSTGVVATGVAVTFSRTGTGTIAAGPVTTDGAGNAVTTYTAPVAAGSDSVTATATIGGVTYTGAAAISYAP